MKQNAVYFYQYLPPWRIDVFNEIAKIYNLTIVFTNAECEGFTYNRKELLSKLIGIRSIFLNNGFKIGSRPVRFGIYKILKELNPAVVFSHEYSPTSMLVALYKQIGRLHYKYYVTTSDNLQMAESSSGLKAFARNYVLRYSDGVIVYSNSVRNWYQSKFPKLNVGICPNIQNPDTLLSYRNNFSVRINKYKEQFNLHKYKIILYTGRLVDVKGLDLLINAYSKADTDHYKLVIVGSGNKEDELKRLSSQLKLSNKIIFAGFYTGIDLYAWYDMANFFILPSRYEPFGAVVNEALVYGCPVVASKYIGATDFIDSQNGILFDPLNEDEFIKIISFACQKYKDFHGEVRANLMPCSFKDYIDAFKVL